MKLSSNFKNITKIILIYILCYIGVIVLLKDVSKCSFLKPYMQKYRYTSLAFSLTFPILLRLFNVKFKYIKKFYIFILIALLFSLVNLGPIYTQNATTPDPVMFPLLTTISIINSYPFTSVIVTLVGYNLEKLSYIAVPLYIGTLFVINYGLNKIRINKDK